MNDENKLERAARILDKLKQEYFDARCELDYSTPYELLVAVILSAQCTDKRVNLVTKKLFERANTPYAMMSVPQGELESLIRSCGFYRNKAAAILSAGRDIIDKYDGKVPDKLKELISLKGVGIKTAKVVLAEIYGQPYVAVDTHVFRVSKRLGLSDAKTPDKMSEELEQIFCDKHKPLCHHLIIWHGRRRCKAVRPICELCVLKEECKYE